MCFREGEVWDSKRLAKLHARAAVLHTLAFLASFVLVVSYPNKIVVDGFPVSAWIALFFGVTAIFEMLASQVRVMRVRLSDGYAGARWIEYSLSATVMLIAIAQLSTLTNAVILVNVVALPSVLTMVFGYLAEKKRSMGWFYAGCVVGIVPWIPISERFFANVHEVPDFVIAIFVSLFILFLPFPVIAWYYLQERINFAEAEFYYTVASFTAKFALGIQVLAGALRNGDDDIEY